MPPNTPSVIPMPAMALHMAPDAYSGSGNSPRLVDELGRRQVVEPTTERRVRELGDRLEQRERDIFTDDGGDLEEVFVLVSKPVDARWRHHLDGGRELDRLGRLHQPILSALPRQHVRFHQRPAGIAPARSNGEEAAEFRDDMLAFWTATRHR